MRALIFFFLFFGLSFHVLAQLDPLTQAHGARSQSLGNIKTHIWDSWAVFNNIGALDRIEQSEIGLGFDQRYGLKELSTLDLALAYKNQLGTIGVGVSRFGGKLFNQQSFGLGFSNQLGIVSFGAKLDWFQTQQEGFGSSGAILLSLGGIAELSPDLWVGAHFSNINRGKISPESSYRLPTAIQMGIHYRPGENISLFSELEKDISIQPILKFGLEYQLQDWIQLRTGFNSNPGRLFFGLGFLPGKFTIQYAYGQNATLGTSHHLSLGIKWKEN